MAASTDPFSMVWFYNSETGSVISEPALGDTIQSHLPGWHGPFGTKAEALAYYTSNESANPSWKAPAGLAAALGNEAGDAASAATSGVTGFLGKLGSRNLWIRVAKVIVGLGLIIIGLVHLTHAQNIATAVTKGAVLA